MENSSTKTEIDEKSFFTRLGKLHDAWKSGREDENWNAADSLVIATGEAEEDVLYKKSSALHMWLFAYEFPETIILICANSVKILSSQKKVQIMKNSIKDLASSPVPLEFLVKSDPAKDFKIIIDAMQKSFSGKSYGTLLKEKPRGSWIASWQKELLASGIKPVDANAGFSDVLAVKDSKELQNIKNASSISTWILKQNLLPEIETIIDEGKKVTHRFLAEQVEAVLEDPSKISKKLQKDQVDTCYSPIIQSGGVYELKPSAESNNNNLSPDTIICSVGAKYKSYCSNVGRTYLVDPSPVQSEIYQILFDLQQLLISSLKPGIKLNSVYNQAIEMIRNRKPELIDKFTKNCGFGIGLEFREPTYEINAKNEKTVRVGMVFNLAVGFSNLELPDEKKTFAVFLADTVEVKENETLVLTEKAIKTPREITYYLEKDDPSAPVIVKKEEKPAAKPPPKVSIPSQIIESKFRESTVQRKEEKEKLLELEAKRREHQKQLEQKAAEEAAERFSKGKKKDVVRSQSSNIDSYKDVAQYPKEIVKNKIYVDNQRESVFFPIYGYMVPFHISTIKNASKSDEEFLRINFTTPDSTIAIGKQDTAPPLKAIRIKELSFRFTNPRDLNNAQRLIKELRKRVTERETERRETANLIEQEKLVISKVARNPKLSDVFVRPNPVGRRTTGILEAHANGFRFSPGKGEHIDILYKNVQHAFFQPAEKELIVLVHFHLHNSIMVGKKRTNDIQFCTEVMEVSQSLEGRRYDADELEDEQRERQLRQRLNTEFQNFVHKLEDAGSLEFDIPYRELGFFGVPNRSSVLLQPTVHCLVNLSEMPFFVLTLKNIEIAYFERVHDYDKKVCHINSIASESLDTIKEWLDECDIKYYEGTQTLNWDRIMVVVKEDPVKFHTKDGGWAFLNPESGDEDEDSETSEDDFNPNKEESESGSEEEEEEEEAAPEEEESDEDEPVSDEEEEEGEDWDELEEKARKSDMQLKERKRARGEEDSDEEDERRPKKGKKK